MNVPAIPEGRRFTSARNVFLQGGEKKIPKGSLLNINVWYVFAFCHVFSHRMVWIFFNRLVQAVNSSDSGTMDRSDQDFIVL